MINSVEQYEYVIGENVDEAHPHGDLDRIVIDGEVMPLRTGDTGNLDKDGNAIPRQKIMRGEDIAFMLEAVAQRWNEYWWAEYVWWYWESSGKKYVTEANGVPAVSFSRKLSAGWVRYLWGALDNVCDFALVSIDGISEAVTDYGKTFEEVYGRAGLSEGLRFHRTHPAPSNGAALPPFDAIFSLFMTESYLNCAVLSAGPRFHSSFAQLDLGFEIEGDDVFASNDGSHNNLFWGAVATKRREDNGEGGTDLKSGTMYCYPKSDVEFFRVRAPHLAELKVVFCIRVYRQVYGGYDQKLVWLPIVAAKSGEWFSLTAGACGFSSKAGVVSLCQKSGLGVPDAPDLGDSYSATDSVRIEIFSHKPLGRWDDHTKWR